MRAARPLSVILLCVASVAWAGDAAATCVARNLIQPVDETCEVWPGEPWPADLPLRLSFLSRTLCQARGGPGNTTERGLSAGEEVEVELWRDGCAAPEEVALSLTDQTCGTATVAVTDGPLGPGTYQVRWRGQSAKVVVAGGDPTPCPSEEAYRQRLQQAQIEQLSHGDPPPICA